MSTTLHPAIRQKNVESLKGNPSPLLLLYQAVLEDQVELRSVSLETNRGLDPDMASSVVDHYADLGWSILHVTPRPDGLQAIVGPTRDITQDHIRKLAEVIQFDRSAALKKFLKRDGFLTGGEFTLFSDTESVTPDGWAIETPFGPVRTRFEPSPRNANDGHAAYKLSAAQAMIATAIYRRGKISKAKALARAKRHLKGATHVQTFFAGSHGASKGLHVLRDDKDFERQFGTDVEAVSDSENLKSEMWLSPGHFTGKLNIWRPRGRRSVVLTASEDLRRRLSSDVLGWAQTLTLQTAAFQKLLSETKHRISTGQPFTQEEAVFPSWTEAYQEKQLYSSDEERGIAAGFAWTGSIYPKLYGGIGAYTARPGSRVPIQGIMCIFGGNGHYYGRPETAAGFVAFENDHHGTPHSVFVSSTDFPLISFILDTSDHDGDLGLVVPALDPEGYLSKDKDALWVMLLRTPASPGGIAWLRANPSDWHRLVDAGAMPITVNGPVPYREFMLPDEQGNPPVHTLRPIGDVRSADAWDTTPENKVKEAIHIRNQAALIGVFYRVMTAGHNADILDLPVPQWVEDLYAQHKMPPSTTAGASTCFSDFVDSVGKTLTPPIDAMAEILCTAVTEHGVKLDRCIKQSLWQSMFEAFGRTTDWDHRKIAQQLNAAFTMNCMGDHWRTTQSIQACAKSFDKEMLKLQLLANGPATLLMADPASFTGELVATITAVQQRIGRLWASKFAADRDIDAQTRPGEGPDTEESNEDPEDATLSYWDMLSEQEAANQKAAGYRRTANTVARVIANSILEANEAGHHPVTYAAAWIRLNALSTNRFGVPKNNFRQAPQPLNTTSLFRALSLLQQDDPDLAEAITTGFAQQWPGSGPTAIVRLSDPDAIIPGERAEIRLNSANGEYLLCRNGKEPLCRVISGGAQFTNLPLTYVGNPQPMDPTGDSSEQQDLHLFIAHSVYSQTVSLEPADDLTDFAVDEEVHIVRETTPGGPVYHLATTAKFLQQQLKAGHQAVLNRAQLSGTHEQHMGRQFRYTGIASNGNFLLRDEHKKTAPGEKLIDSLIQMLLPSST